jgi:excisionase family DNA binding protein
MTLWIGSDTGRKFAFMSTVESESTKQYLTTIEAARLARTSAQTIRAWIRQHRLEAARPGRKFLVSTRSLRAALEPLGKKDGE